MKRIGLIVALLSCVSACSHTAPTSRIADPMRIPREPGTFVSASSETDGGIGKEKLRTLENFYVDEQGRIHPLAGVGSSQPSLVQQVLGMGARVGSAAVSASRIEQNSQSSAEGNASANSVSK